MPEIVTHCPLCAAESSTPFDQREFRGQPVFNVICSSCGLVYQSPRMTEAESQNFYAAEYRLLYQGQEGPSPADLAVQSKRALVTLDFIRPYIPSCGRILEIGCSSGILLRHFRDHFHAQATGIEPGNSYRQYAQSAGVEVYASLAEMEQQTSSTFDLVSMLHVLEHMAHPVEYLQDLREKYLAAEGWLLVEVPNLYAHDCFEVAHLVSFSRHSLTQVVQKAGYRPVSIRAHGQPRSRLIPLYLTMLARPVRRAPSPIRPEHLVRAKRRAGFFYRRLATRLLPHQAWLQPDKTE